MKLFVLYAVASALLLSFPFLVPGTGPVALVALIPLLWLERRMTAESARGFFWYAWLSFSLWNLLTTFWVCNATLGGGLFAIFANAFKMALIFQIFHRSKRRLHGALPYLFLAAMWIAWEKIYFVSPIPWPWLVLGNAFAGSIACVQWYEWTGTLGGSLWIWTFNLVLYGLLVIRQKDWWPRFNRKAKWTLVLTPVLLLVVPLAVSLALWFHVREEGKPLDVLISQPNFDPYEKFERYTQKEQDEVLERQIREFLPGQTAAAPDSADGTARAPLLILAPETFTAGLWLPQARDNASVRHFAGVLETCPEATLLMGASAYDRIESKERPSDTARKLRDGLWYESYNSALSFNAGARRLDIYHKSRLVPATESTPFPSVLGRFDDEVLGGVLARCIGQKEPSLLYCYAPADAEPGAAEDIPFAPIICYESIFGDYCREFVLQGAQLLCVITNDAWWGDTPGYRQHLDFARLRAVETRRDVARSANTGISAIISRRGELVASTPWWTRTVLKGKVHLNTRETFFVRHGDIVGRGATFLFLLLLLLWLIRLFNPLTPIHMKRLSLFALAVVFVCACNSPKQNAVRPPQMGWSSWNAYMVDISDSIIMRQADLLVSKGLKDAGYHYVNIDDGYFGYRDSTGRLISHPVRFPDGLEPTVRHIHSLGLKAGIYSDVGSRTCGSWYNNDPNGFGVGLYGHDAQDCEMFFNELDFDFIKIDFCGAREYDFTARDRYTQIRHVMDSVAKKPVEFNLCRWSFPGVWACGIADSWRVSGDIRPVWSSIVYIVDKNKYLSAYAGGGRYNDMDMLALGYNEHPSPFWEEGLGLSYQEEEAHFGMWCILTSPLLLGCALEYMPERTREIVTNPELIAINQDVLGVQAYTVAEGVFVKDILQRRGLTRVVALYNPADTARFFRVDPALLELEGPLKVRDLNRREDIDSLSMCLNPHQAKILKVTGTRRLEPVRYEAEWGFCPAFSGLQTNTGPRYVPCADASNGAVVTLLGASDGFVTDASAVLSPVDSEGPAKPAAENTLEWREVWSEHGGDYEAVVSLFPEQEVSYVLSVNGESVPARTGVPMVITLRKGYNRIAVGSPDAALPPLDCLTLNRRSTR